MPFDPSPRARIILFCADGLPHRQIKRERHTDVGAIVHWRGRYEQEGLDEPKISALRGDRQLSYPERFGYPSSKDEPTPEDPEGFYPSGKDALAITQIACTAHGSVVRGEAVAISS